MYDPLVDKPLTGPTGPENSSAWPQRIAIIFAFIALVVGSLAGGWLDKTTRIVIIALATLFIIWSLITWFKKNPDMEKLLISLLMIFLVLAALVYFLILNRY